MILNHKAFAFFSNNGTIRPCHTNCMSLVQFSSQAVLPQCYIGSGLRSGTVSRNNKFITYKVSS